MQWVFRKLTALTGAVVAAASGAGASQFTAFVHAYLQRLGGHIDEARRTLDGLQSGAIGRAVTDGPARRQLIESFTHRLNELETARDAIAQAGPFARPAVFAIHADPDIAGAVMRNFTPAVPLDTPSIVFAVAGLALGWVLFDMACWPVRRAAARRRARRNAAAKG